MLGLMFQLSAFMFLFNICFSPLSFFLWRLSQVILASSFTVILLVISSIYMFFPPSSGSV